MNIDKIEDQKKEKVDNIRKQMRYKWIPKTIDETNSNHGSEVAHEMGDSNLSN